MLQLVGSGAQSLRSLTVGSSTTSSFGGQGSSVESQIQECYSCTLVIIHYVFRCWSSLVERKVSFKCIIIVSKHMQVDGQIGDRAPRIKKKVNEK